MIKQLLKKVLIIYLVVIACVFTPTYRAYAASPAGWAFNSFNMATSVVTAIKGGASASAAIAKSPITAKIAKGIVGGVIAGAAIPLAISQISGIALDAVDWLFDPANSSIKYKSKDPNGVYTAKWNEFSGTAATIPALCNQFFDYMRQIPVVKAQTDKGVEFTAVMTATSCSAGYGGKTYWTITPTYAATDTYKTIPISTIADKIYDNAKTDAASASVVNQAVKEYVNEGSADTALDNAKADADATHGCGTGTQWNGSACVADTPTTPSTPTDTPFDPSGIIDAIKSVFDAVKGVFDAVMSLPDVINNALDALLIDIKDFFQPAIDKVNDFVDWVKQEPTTDNPTQPDVTTLPTPPTDSVNISFDGGCPAPKVVPWSFAGRNVDITIPYTPICDTATLLNPLIKLAASLGAVFIIAGIRRGDDG